MTPIMAEREAHEAEGHANYKSWCRACFSGRGRSDAHQRLNPDGRAVVVLAIDYGYLESRLDLPEGVAPSPMLISRASQSWKVSAHALPSKGVAHPYNV